MWKGIQASIKNKYFEKAFVNKWKNKLGSNRIKITKALERGVQLKKNASSQSRGVPEKQR